MVVDVRRDHDLGCTGIFGELVKRIGSLRLVGLATSVACFCCIAQFLVLRPAGSAFMVAPEVIWLSVLNASLCTAVPVLLVRVPVGVP